MIIVTGTKRSGTSMWMQILKAAGYPVLGDAFPRDWGRTIREANVEGFYESPLRSGIYYATNPSPRTGRYLFPHETRRTAVKVFVPGLIKSDLAFVDKVIATMRNWREYRPSVERLYAIERENKRALACAHGQGREPVFVEHMPALLEWWNDNFRLLRDVLTRRYPVHMVSYAAVLTSPECAIRDTLAWLGGGQVEPALTQVRKALRTQRVERAEPGSSDFSAEVEAVFDELYARVHEQRPLDAAFIAKLNATHERLEPHIRKAEARAKQSRLRARALRRAQRMSTRPERR